jgi:hypothetical protein
LAQGHREGDERPEIAYLTIKYVRFCCITIHAMRGLIFFLYLQDPMNNASDGSNATQEVYPCDLPPFFPPSLNIPASLDYIQACIILMLGATGFLFNLFILFMVVRFRVLHQRIMYLALQIVCIDLIYTLTIPPVIFISGASGTWLLGQAMCNIFGIIHDFFAMFRFTMTLVLTLDRFMSVFWPFFYDRKSTHMVLVMLGGVYLASTLRAFLPVTGILGCHIYIPTFKTCSALPSCSPACYWFVAGATSVVIIAGALVPLALYVLLFCKVRSIKRGYEPSLGTEGEVGANDVVSPTLAEIKTSLTNLGGFGSRRTSYSMPDSFAEAMTSFVNLERRTSYSMPENFDSERNSAFGTRFGCRLGSSPDDSSIPGTNEGCTRSPQTSFRFVLSSVNNDEIIDPSIAANTSTNGRSEIDFLKPPNGCIETERPGDDYSVRSTSPAIFNHNKIAAEANHLNHEGETPPVPTEQVPGRKSHRRKINVRANVTMFILLMSVIGCTAPAFVLYGVQLFLPRPERVVLIVNMMVGRIFFNLLPVIDSLAIMRHQEFRLASKKLIRTIKRRLQQQ